MKLISIAFFVAAMACNFVAADELQLHDTLILKSGSQLSGRIIETVTEGRKEYVVFKTLTGSVYKIDVKRLVKRVHPVDSAYVELTKKMDQNSPDAHWEMYAWCKEKDKSGFKREMEHHLRRIVELDRNDEKAMRLLGHNRFDGRLFHEHHQLSGHGYVKMTGGWVPKQFTELYEMEEGNKQVFTERKIAIGKWARQIDKVSLDTLLSELKSVTDKYSVGFLYERALKEKRPAIRLVYVEAIGDIETDSAQNALIHFAIRDDEPRIRDRALSLLQQPHVNKASAAAKASVFLQDPNRLYLIRTANLLKDLDQMSAFSPLVAALQTTHTIAPGQNPDRMNSTFGSGGSGGNTFSFGGKKPVKKKFDNQEVLSALRKITGKELGYDREPWKAWYTSQFTIGRYDISGDE